MNPLKKTRLSTGICAPLSIAIAAALSTAQADSVYDTLASKERYSTLVTAIDAAGLQGALSNEDASLTVFAPPNEAFAAIPAADLTALLADTEALTAVLTYHVLGEEIRFRDFESGPAATLEGSDVEIDVTRFGWWWRNVTVDGVRIVRADRHADNGVIHEISSVLNPATEPLPTILGIAAADPDNFSTLAELAEIAGLTRVLDSEHYELTLFAPTNAAFAELPPALVADLVANPRELRKVLLYHLVRGTVGSGDLSSGAVPTLARQDVNVVVGEDEDGNVTVSVNGGSVVVPDVIASNGIVHVIDQVLVPELPKTLTDIVVENDDLATLEVALGAAGLVDTFDSTRRYPSYTIFAPNNAAFDALPEGALAGLLEDPDALAGVLQLHVVRGKLPANRLYDGRRLTTLSGERLLVDVDSEGTVSVNGSEVVSADLKATNGVLHIIDSVIMEDPYTLTDLVTEKRFLSTLEVALGATGLDAALDGEGPFTVFAPTDRAFGKLPEGTVEALLGDTDALSNILLYHVASGEQSLADLGEAGSATTLQGSDVTVSSERYRIWWWHFTVFKVNDSVLLATDLQTDNGIAHVIDTVLLPPAPETDDEPAE